MKQKAGQYIIKEFTREFHSDYEDLWQNSFFETPFNGPNFIKLLFENSLEPIGFLNYQDGYLNIAVFFKRKEFKEYIYLGDGYTDHNVICIRKNVSNDTLVSFLSYVIKQLNTSIFLKNVPIWQDDLEAWTEASIANGLKCISFKAWKNPIFKLDLVEAQNQQMFSNNFKKKRLTTYYNKLKKDPGFKFEIDESNNVNQSWIDEFCMNHESRWNITNTPSQYISKSHRDFLVLKLNSYIRDKTLIRFSFVLNGINIVSVICLKKNDYILYSLPSYSTSYDYTHASQSLICQIGQWAAGNGFTLFDFGVGEESYKLRFSNSVEDFYRVYITPTGISKFYLKGLFEKFIRDNKLVNAFYNKFVLSLIRIKLVHKLKVIQTKLLIQRSNFKLDKYFFVTKVKQRIDNKIKVYKFIESTLSQPQNSAIKKISFYDYIDFIQIDGPITLLNRNSILQNCLQNIKVPFGLYVNDELVSVALVSSENFEIEKFVKSDKTWQVITDCFTINKFRGNGYYPILIGAIARNNLSLKLTTYIYASSYNKASIKGIIKAGFSKV